MIKITLLCLFYLCSIFLYSNENIFASDAETVEKSDTKVITMGIFPRRNPSITTLMFTPLAKYLSDKLGRPVKLVTPRYFPDFWDKVEKNKYDIVHYNQYHYVKSHKEFGYKVILKNIEQGKSTIAGALIVRKDSGINKITDLKGKNIVFGGGKKAMQSHIVARFLLLNSGLKDSDYKWSYSSNPPNAILSSFFKQSDAAGAGDKVLNLKVVKKQIDTDEMKYLLVGEQLPHLPWALNKNISKKLHDKIQNILLDLIKTGAGRRILLKMRLDGFSKATDDEYNDHRKIIKAVLHENY